MSNVSLFSSPEPKVTLLSWWSCSESFQGGLLVRLAADHRWTELPDPLTEAGALKRTVHARLPVSELFLVLWWFRQVVVCYGRARLYKRLPAS